ncbi:MAG: MBL fold metallo-hydrolase [Candidatus Koribacter versatilis]|uniref:MBL fold metallo-hydrolase n=1 Tax=Candidatus Korobacter versatilis TaxID=658062 RepID=A0A932A7Q0_9BACT|nr:MBL fold metallo-hydrolase [Candidatus Koribacter versatilis]
MPHPGSIPVQSTTVGDFELTVLSDGDYYLDGGAFFGVIPKVMWQKRMQPDEQNRLSVGVNSLLIRTGKHTVLVETGIGNKLGDKPKQIFQPEEKLLQNLAAAKVAPEDIDVVINTHLHFDHCGWNTVMKDGRAVATFPKAKYYVQEGEWQHAREQTERDRVSYLSPNYDPLIENGQMELLNGEREIVPGISVKLFPGHTRNLQAVVIQSGAQRACYISDLIPTSHHLDLTWVMAFDLFPLETIASRKRFYARAVPEKWLVVFTHDPQVPWGHLEATAPGKLTLKPLEKL